MQPKHVLGLLLLRHLLLIWQLIILEPMLILSYEPRVGNKFRLELSDLLICCARLCQNEVSVIYLFSELICMWIQPTNYNINIIPSTTTVGFTFEASTNKLVANNYELGPTKIINKLNGRALRSMGNILYVGPPPSIFSS